MAPIPPFVAKVTANSRGVELHTTHGHELLTVSSRTAKAFCGSIGPGGEAPKWSFPGKRGGEHASGTQRPGVQAA